MDSPYMGFFDFVTTSSRYPVRCSATVGASGAGRGFDSEGAYIVDVECPGGGGMISREGALRGAYGTEGAYCE